MDDLSLDLQLLLSLSGHGNGSGHNLSHTAAASLDYDSILDEYYRTVQNQDPDQYRRDLITYYLMGIGGVVVSCFGLVGNVLSLLVLTRRTMRLSTNSYLAALSVCDSLVLIATLVLLSNDVVKPVRGESRWQMREQGVYPHIFPYVHPLAFTFQVTSIWLTLAFTVDRYIMICHPFKAEPYCTISRARKVIGLLCIAAAVFNIPKFFEYETVMIPLPMHNATKLGYDLTTFGRSHVFREMYHSWFYIAFVCGIPFVTLAFLNAFLMHAVRLSRRRGKEINAADRKRNDTTVMLIGVVAVFFICQMPALVSRAIWAFEHDPKAFKRLPLYTLNEIGNFLIVLNSAINIMPYYFFGRKFRKEFWRLFCHCLLRYNRFQKISRSFSLTVLDQTRRPSQMPPSSHAVKSTPSGDPHKLAVPHAPLIEDESGNPVRKSSVDSVGQHSVSSCMTDDSAHRRVGDAVDVNGKCTGPNSCLLYDRVKVESVSYADEAL